MSSDAITRKNAATVEGHGEVLQILECWLTKNNFYYNRDLIELKIISYSKIKDGPTVAPVYGVVAKSDIAAGTRLCTIPCAAILSARSCGIADIIEQEGYDGMFALTVSLFYEMSLGEGSPWYGYIQSMPVYLMEHDSPVLWSKSRLKCLKGTDAYRISVRSFNFLKDDFRNIMRPLFKNYPLVFSSCPEQVDRLNFRNFMICATQVKAKAYKIGNTYGLGLVPLVDLFNVTTENHSASLVSGAYACAYCGKSEAYCACELSDDWENDGEAELESDGTDQDSPSIDSEIDMEFPPPILLDPDAKTFDSNLSHFVTKQQNSFLELVAYENVPANHEVLCHCSVDSQVALELGWRYFNPGSIGGVILYDEIEFILDNFHKGDLKFMEKYSFGIPDVVMERIRERLCDNWETRKSMWKSKFFCALKRNSDIHERIMSQLIGTGIDRSMYAARVSDIMDQDRDAMCDYFPLPGEDYTDNDIYLSQKMDINGYPSPELLIYLHTLFIPAEDYDNFFEYPGSFGRYVINQFLHGWLSGNTAVGEPVEHTPSLEDSLSSYVIYTSTLKRLERYPRLLEKDIKELEEVDKQEERHLAWALSIRIREIQILLNALRSKTCLIGTQNR